MRKLAALAAMLPSLAFALPPVVICDANGVCPPTVPTTTVPAGATAFSCNQAAITSTTLCQAAQGAGVSLYVTDVWLSNGSTTASALSLIYADAGACTGTPAQVTPATTLASNAGAGSFTVYSFTTPIKLPANKALCCKTGGSTAFSCMVSGFYGP